MPTYHSCRHNVFIFIGAISHQYCGAKMQKKKTEIY